MRIAYDGTHYCGWQVQPNGRSIQAVLQEILSPIIGEPIEIVGSGRTDAGVHALGQVAHFRSSKTLDIYRVHHSLNKLLPDDIRIFEMVEESNDFHARFGAKKKSYHYHLWLDPVQLPFQRNYSLHVRQPFDVNAVKEAASYLVGEHDFTSFANEPGAGSVSRNPVRHLMRLDLVEQEGGVRLEFEGNGFLYKMVRNIVGTLCEVGKGKKSPADLLRILAAKDRRTAGQAAPPHGLFLAHVVYERDLLS